jgi:hypothetical protein
VSLEDAQMLPLPVQRPHPPIWIGGTGPRRTLPLTAKFADAWHAFGTPASLRGPSARLDERAVAAGRDPRSITRAGSLSLSEPVDAVRRTVDEWQAAGFDYLVCGWPGEGPEQVEAFVTRVLQDH